VVDKMGILAEKRGEHGNEGDADQGNAATGHQLLHALRLGAGIVIAVALQEVDNAPDAETSAQSNNESLKCRNCSLEEFHG